MQARQTVVVSSQSKSSLIILSKIVQCCVAYKDWRKCLLNLHFVVFFIIVVIFSVRLLIKWCATSLRWPLNFSCLPEKLNSRDIFLRTGPKIFSSPTSEMRSIRNKFLEVVFLNNRWPMKTKFYFLLLRTTHVLIFFWYENNLFAMLIKTSSTFGLSFVCGSIFATGCWTLAECWVPYFAVAAILISNKNNEFN